MRTLKKCNCNPVLLENIMRKNPKYLSSHGIQNFSDLHNLLYFVLFKVINLPEADFVLSVCLTKVLNKMSTEYISLSKDEYCFELQSDKNLTTFNYA